MTSSRAGHAGSRQRFRETDVPLTLERLLRLTSHLDSCTRAQCAGAGIRMRGHDHAARDRERYIQFARRATEPSVTALGLPDMQQPIGDFVVSADVRLGDGLRVA